MNIKSVSKFLRMVFESPISFWIICFVTGIFIYTSFNFYYIGGADENSVFSQTEVALSFTVVPVYAIIIMGLMPKYVVRRLSEFRPALDLPDSEYNNLQRQVFSATISNKHLWLLIVTILISTILVLFNAFDAIVSIIIYFSFIIIPPFFMLYNTSRILRFIYKLQYFPLRVDILDTKPLLTLSQLTQRFAIYLLPITTFFGWFGFKLLLWVLGVHYTLAVIEIILLVPLISLGPLFLILSICVFVLPVLWVRYLILERKSQALSNIALKLSTSFKEHDHFIDTGDLSNIADLSTSISTLTMRRELYKNVSEWPWEGGVLREFLGALVIPIVLWLSQFYLERFISGLSK